jgi:hypothetical protein
LSGKEIRQLQSLGVPKEASVTPKSGDNEAASDDE